MASITIASVTIPACKRALRSLLVISRSARAFGDRVRVRFLHSNHRVPDSGCGANALQNATLPLLPSMLQEASRIAGIMAAAWCAWLLQAR